MFEVFYSNRMGVLVKGVGGVSALEDGWVGVGWTVCGSELGGRELRGRVVGGGKGERGRSLSRGLSGTFGQLVRGYRSHSMFTC